MLTTLAVFAALAAAPAPSDEKVWELILQLEGEKSAAATEQLTPIATRAMPEMIRAAHAAGLGELLAPSPMFCGSSPEMLLAMRHLNGPAGLRAGRLLIALARTDAALAQALAANADPLARIIALLAADPRGPAFLRLLELAAKDPALQVVRIASQLVDCPSRRTPATAEIAAALAARRKQLEPLSRCDEASQAGPFVKAFFENGQAANGWSTSGADAWITTASGGQLHWKCAIAVYAGLVERGRYEASLLLPLVGERMPAEARKAAGALLQRDERKFPEKKRDEVASKLVLGGLPSSAREKIVVPDNPKYAAPDTLAAAALQNAPGAREAIEKRFICRGFGVDDTVALLGFVPSKTNADAAARIAELCKEGKAEAVGALIRMKDPRAVTLFPSVVDEPFVANALGPALRDNWSADWERVLRAHSQHRNFGGIVEAAGHPELKAK